MNVNSNIIGQLALMFLLVLLNAFFTASEIAIVSTDKQKLKLKAEAGDKKAEILLKIIKEPSRFLSTVQAGITFAGFFLSASAAVGISQDLGKFLSNSGIPYGENIAFIGVTLLLAYIMLVFGELVPKRIAFQHSEKFAMFAIKPINIFGKMIKPFVTFLAFSTNFLIKLFGFSTTKVEDKVTLEEILFLINVGQDQGVIDSVKRERIESIINFDDKVAEEIMTARTNVFMMEINNPINPIGDTSEKVLKHSRIPIYEGNKDNIIGVLYLKDYLQQAYEFGFEKVNIKKIMRPPYFVSQRININDLFLQLQQTRNQFAVLVNEYGGFPGIVTMEDIVEEIIGDVYDDYDLDQIDIEKIADNKYYALGSTSINELNMTLNLNLEENSGHYDTLGGLIIYLLGYIPIDANLEKIEYKNLQFDVLEIKRQSIHRVEITKLNKNNKVKNS